MLTKSKVVEELCKLATKVNEDIFDFSVATDCFCNLEEDDNYQFNQEVLDFIKEGVTEKIEGTKVKVPQKVYTINEWCYTESESLEALNKFLKGKVKSEKIISVAYTIKPKTGVDNRSQLLATIITE